MEETTVAMKELTKLAVNSFNKVFGKNPDLGSFAPGRVNLIGEHTDYNDGFVFPMALPLVTVIVGCKSGTDMCKIVTCCIDVDEPRSIEFPISLLPELTPGLPKWANYVKGVLALHPEKNKIPAFEAVIISSVPCGSGLSSSASLEVATFTFVDELLGIYRDSEDDKKNKALLCQKAEHEFANVPCGTMDQMISTFATKDSALLIDCKTLSTKPVELDCDYIAILITNSNVKHELSSGEYAVRKQQCEMASKTLGVSKLREAELEDLEKVKETLDSVCYKRARHVISENKRCQAAFSALLSHSYVEFGDLMNESHLSLKNDFEVSCSELDELVELANGVRGVFGSRMTGGGFGGCTVTLVEKSRVNDVIRHIEKYYSGKPQFYVCTPSAGAGRLQLDK